MELRACLGQGVQGCGTTHLAGRRGGRRSLVCRGLVLLIQGGKGPAARLLPVPQDTQGLLAASHPGGISRRDMKWLSHSPEGFTGCFTLPPKPPQQHAVRRHIRLFRESGQVFQTLTQTKITRSVTRSLTTPSGALGVTSQL